MKEGESMKNMKKIIAVCGNAAVPEESINYKLAYETGKAIIDHGYRMQCGGLDGVMLAACKGARASEKYTDGDIIGLLPSFDPKSANEYVDVIIPTGLDVFRNVIVASAAAVIAVGGGAGTLSEIANAWALKRLVVGYKNAEGWSAKLADTRLDDRIRYPDIPEDRIYGVTDAESALQIIDRYVERYDTYHMGITPGDK